MEIKYVVSREDFIKFNLKYYTKTTSYFSILINTIVIFIIIFKYVVSFDNNTPLKTLCLIILLIISLLFVKKVILFFAKKEFYWKFSLSKYKSSFLPSKLYLDNENIRVINEIGIRKFNYNLIKDISLLDDYLYIRTTYKNDLLIPLSAFNNTDERQLFLKLILDYSGLKLLNKYPNH